MRVVLDSNILVRVFASPNGPAAAAFRLLQAPHVILASDYLLAEFAEAMRYEWVRPLHNLDDQAIEEIVKNLQQKCVSVFLPELDQIPIVSTDRDDDSIIATAVEGRADVLTTRDRHIRSPHVVEYLRGHGVDVLTDVEVLSRLRQTPAS